MVNLLLFFLLPFVQLVTSLHTCEDSCSSWGPLIRFPFALSTNDNSRCSYPGFSYLLSCNYTDQNQTILTLPSSGTFNVRFIDYQSQIMYIQDPGNCLAKRFLEASFDLSETPFVSEVFRTFTFLNCSSNSSSTSLTGFRRVNCMSSDNYTVVAIRNDVYNQLVQPSFPSCQVISRTVFVPVLWQRTAEGFTRLLWVEPECQSCEQRGGTCGYNRDTGFEIGCSIPHSNGLPRSAKYGIILGAGIPGLLCIIGVAFYLCGRVKEHQRPHHQSRTAELVISTAAQPSILLAGLDVPTIESYPKTQLGDSGRLPMPGHNTCPICLSEYQPKEMLRTIPECRHYFHVGCIDEWLKVNATCPLCRNSPEDSSVGVSSSAESSSLSSSLTT